MTKIKEIKQDFDIVAQVELLTDKINEIIRKVNG